MKWKDPNKELPKQGQPVWIMLQPHKDRGSLLKSAMSIEILCGEANYSQDGKFLEIQNSDELGRGCVGWSFFDYNDDGQQLALGWLPVEEMFSEKPKFESPGNEFYGAHSASECDDPTCSHY